MTTDTFPQHIFTTGHESKADFSDIFFFFSFWVIITCSEKSHLEQPCISPKQKCPINLRPQTAMAPQIICNSTSYLNSVQSTLFDCAQWCESPTGWTKQFGGINKRDSFQTQQKQPDNWTLLALGGFLLMSPDWLYLKLDKTYFFLPFPCLACHGGYITGWLK